MSGGGQSVSLRFKCGLVCDESRRLWSKNVGVVSGEGVCVLWYVYIIKARERSNRFVY